MKHLVIPSVAILASSIVSTNGDDLPSPFPPEVTPVPFYPTNISGDGTTVIGNAVQDNIWIMDNFLSSLTIGPYYNAPFWTMQTGTSDLFPILPADAYNFRSNGISQDGRFVGGTFTDNQTWSNYSFILDRNNPGDLFISHAGLSISDISDNGLSYVGHDFQLGAVWNPNIVSGTPTALGGIPNESSNFTEVEAMDGAGTRAAGTQYNNNNSQAVYWNLSGENPSAIAIPFQSTGPGTYTYSSDISRNGNFIVGQQEYDTLQPGSVGLGSVILSNNLPFLYTVGGDIVDIPVSNGYASGVSNTGRVVGSTRFKRAITAVLSTNLDAPIQETPEAPIEGAFIYDQVAGARSINQWLADSGVEIGPVFFATAEAISEDGTVVVGRFDDELIEFGTIDMEEIPYYGYIAREGSGVINPDEFIPTLETEIVPLVENLFNLTLNGAHHVPLQMMGSQRHAWIIGDYARNDRFDSDSSLFEAGFATDLMDNQLVAGIGFGQSWIDQDLAFGGDSGIHGQYILGELSYRPTGNPFIYTLTGILGDWSADIDRNYINGAMIDTSYGDTDVTAAALRMRVDWLDALSFQGFGITPKIQYTIAHTEVDGYTETGGGFPATFNTQDSTSHEIRYGVSAARPLLNDKALLRLRLEGIHRFDDSNSNASGQVVGLFPFSTSGQTIKRNSLLFGVDFDYNICQDLTLTSSLSTATSAQEPVLGASLGLRKSF
ncbi:MAG: autotransporter domain-containing protein [Luteolibacter sp.]